MTVNYGVSDGIATTPASASWTVTGTNDAPVVTAQIGDSAGTAAPLHETNAGQTTSGTLSVTDADLSDRVSMSVFDVVSNGHTGSLSHATLEGFLTVTPTDIAADPGTNGNVKWTFASGTEAFNYLADGEILELQYRVRATDNSGTGNNIGDGIITIRIEGTNDAAAITLPSVQTVVEAGGVANGTAGVALATGTLTSTDVDGTANLFTAASGTSTYGTWSIGTNGVYSYNLSNDQANVQALTQGQAVSDTFTVSAADGTAQVVTVNVTGTNDAAVISGSHAGVVIEAGGVADGLAGTPTATGTLTDTDVDNAANASR